MSMSTIASPAAQIDPAAALADSARRAQPQNNSDDLQKAAEQFESMFIDMWLKSARKANQVFAENNLFNSNQLQMQQEMLDHEMAVHMAGNGGIGLAPTIVRQLGGTVEPAAPAQDLGLQPAVELPAAPDARTSTTSDSGAADNVEVAHFGQRVSAFTSPGEFVAQLAPVIERALEATGLPPLAVLSQAALETGWGQHVIAGSDGQLSHNLFGVKASSPGADNDSVAIASKEFEFGQWRDRISQFRSYPDWTSAVEDYVSLLQSSPRYQQVEAAAGDAVDFVRGLQQAGYATDPKYADKIVSVMRSIESMEF